MATVQHRSPVLVRHPEAPDVLLTVKRGDDFADDHPVVSAYPWLFVDAEPAEPVTSVEVSPVKRARRA